MMKDYHINPEYTMKDIADIAGVSREAIRLRVKRLYGDTKKELIKKSCITSKNYNRYSRLPHVIDLLHKNNIDFSRINYKIYKSKFGELETPINDTNSPPGLIDIYFAPNNKVFAIRRIRRFRPTHKSEKLYYHYIMRSHLEVDLIIGVICYDNTIQDYENLYIFPHYNYNTGDSFYISEHDILSNKYLNKFFYLT